MRTSQPKLDWNKATGRLECRVCGASYETTINCEKRAARAACARGAGRGVFSDDRGSHADLSEPIDLFCEWVDACELEEEERTGGGGAT